MARRPTCDSRDEHLGEQTLYLGWITIALACAGAVHAIRAEATDHRARAWLLVAVLVVGASLSFGPSATGLAPFDLLARVPGLNGFRAPGRFALLVCFAVAGLTTLGLVHLGHRTPRAPSVVIVLLAIAMMAERFVVGFPPGQPRPEAMPEIYALARADKARAAIVLPMFAGQPEWFFESDYLLYSTTADFLPLANGYGRWPTDEYLGLADAMRAFPSSASAEALRRHGITHVILHTGRMTARASEIRARLPQSRDYAVAAERGTDVLVRVVSLN